MHDFKYYLDTIGEIGFVQELRHSMVFASGLPGAKHGEVVVFETGEMGQVFSLNRDYVEILVFSNVNIRVGSQVARSGETFKVAVANELLGKTISPIGELWAGGGTGDLQNLPGREIDSDPPKVLERKQVDRELVTGVTLVDFVVPLSKGQRELVIGDRKTGKTEFLKSTILSQSARGGVCIYAVIGQKKTDILNLSSFFFF